MAVETRYVVIRNEKEVAVFTDPREADEHDKMLDRAEALAELIQAAREAGEIPDLFGDEDAVESLSIALAKRQEEMTAIFTAKGGKPKAPKPRKAANPDETAEEKAENVAQLQRA